MHAVLGVKFEKAVFKMVLHGEPSGLLGLGSRVYGGSFGNIIYPSVTASSSTGNIAFTASVYGPDYNTNIRFASMIGTVSSTTGECERTGGDDWG